MVRPRQAQEVQPNEKRMDEFMDKVKKVPGAKGALPCAGFLFIYFFPC